MDPLVYFFASLSPGENVELYNTLVVRLGASIDARFAAHPSGECVGAGRWRG